MKSLGRDLWLRPMSSTDLDAVHAIECSAYPVPWSRNNLAESLAYGHHCVCLMQEQRLIGSYISQTIVDEAHLLNICIAPELQRRGLSELLLQEWMLAAREQGAIRALLEVRVSNPSAQALYQKLGFQLLSRRKGYYRTLTGKEDGLVMARTI